MAQEAKAAKAKSGQGPSFMVQKFDATDMGVKAGRAVLRGGTFIGLSAVANMDSIKTKKIRKHMGWMAMVLGLAGEMVIDDRNNAGRVTSGVAQGLTTWGMIDTTATLLGEANRAKLGLAGLGAPGRRDSDSPSNDNGIDWFALAREADEESQGADQPAASSSMAGTNGSGSSLWNA